MLSHRKGFIHCDWTQKLHTELILFRGRELAKREEDKKKEECEAEATSLITSQNLWLKWLGEESQENNVIREIKEKSVASFHINNFEFFND